ncbi:hypothetical protein I41_24910 [Lacipirellula limnantheis]|uniref:Uncharacterized protein n=1 Tax=Lacipirellula limnantheis TaxID=2528024 RepID=A0A517TY51_9BACT|nr:hypothetical protein I41_24910 [Lacipirellula limnantheis]
MAAGDMNKYIRNLAARYAAQGDQDFQGLADERRRRPRRAQVE